jgi:phosphatidylserine/phosphatidylglycerophosphate/cardiolipin synthase-like enzyme
LPGRTGARRGFRRSGGTGSFNFTKQAENANAENLLVIRDATLAEKYAANWKAHAEHSEAYEGRSDEGTAPVEKKLRKRKAA